MSDPLEVIAEQLVTANMIAVFQDDGLTSAMTWADRLELERNILRRVGVKDA